jgi:hypothetical protein
VHGKRPKINIAKSKKGEKPKMSYLIFVPYRCPSGASEFLFAKLHNLGSGKDDK